MHCYQSFTHNVEPNKMYDLIKKRSNAWHGNLTMTIKITSNNLQIYQNCRTYYKTEKKKTVLVATRLRSFKI